MLFASSLLLSGIAVWAGRKLVSLVRHKFVGSTDIPIRIASGMESSVFKYIYRSARNQQFILAFASSLAMPIFHGGTLFSILLCLPPTKISCGH
jgi:hypothetical protein